MSHMPPPPCYLSLFPYHDIVNLLTRHICHKTPNFGAPNIHQLDDFLPHKIPKRWKNVIICLESGTPKNFPINFLPPYNHQKENFSRATLAFDEFFTVLFPFGGHIPSHIVARRIFTLKKCLSFNFIIMGARLLPSHPPPHRKYAPEESFEVIPRILVNLCECGKNT